MARYPVLPVYILYGTHHDQVLKAHDEILDMLIPEEMRHEAVTEYQPPGNQHMVEMAKILPDLAAELGTLSLFDDEDGYKKVAIVHNPKELLGGARGAGGKGKKGDASMANLLEWVQNVLPKTGNHLIIMALENEAEGREVDNRLKFMQALLQIGQPVKCSDTKAVFRIDENLARRNMVGTLKAVNDLWGNKGGDTAVYNAVVRSIRYMLQASIIRDGKLPRDKNALAFYLPEAKPLSVMGLHDFVKKRYLNEPAQYRTADLLAAYVSLKGVFRAMRPAAGDVFVPDARKMMEKTLIELFSSPRPFRR